MMDISNEMRSQILIDALPYIQKYHNKIVVVKYGGNAMTNAELKEAVMSDIVLLTEVGIKVVLVHGGGLCGKLNKELVSALQLHGAKALGLCGIDGQMIMAEKLDSDVDLGYVGQIQKITTKPILDALNNGYVPIISTVATSADGQSYNINADTAAARIASCLRAENLILMTDIAGLLKDKDDPSTLIPTVNVSDVPYLKKTGIISGGMIPKIECCVEAVRRGVKKTSIIDGRIPHSILIELLSNEGAGTQFI